jgi:hypothetical protein
MKDFQMFSGSLPQPGMRKSVLFISAMLLLAGCFFGAAPDAFAAPDSVEVRRVGLSRVGEHTMLTVVLTQPAAPLIAQRPTADTPQMVIDFPQARAGSLPAEQFGDNLLVKRVLTRVSPSGRGVQIILEMNPERPYAWWRQTQPLQGGQTAFIMGFKAEGAPARAQMLPHPPAAPVEPRAAPVAEPRRTQPAPGPRPAGGYGELRHLMPQAATLWQFLEKDGWAVVEVKDYDRPGKRFSRGFTLTNPRYPEAVVNIAHIPANVPGAPHINIIDLDFERLNSPTAREYREMKKWDFSKIKKNFEDIGDFFDDAMKPLRVKLRQECQELALGWSSLIQEFVRQAAPQHPQADEEVMNHIEAKVNPRFEGVQFTISEKPLLILNLVDFLYIRAYYL